MATTETNILTCKELVRQNEEVAALWRRLTPARKKELLAIGKGKKVIDLLNDAVIKTIFDPDAHGDRLSRFISSVLGFPVKVLHSVRNEGRVHSIYSKAIVLDLVVQLENGSLANVEIQRYGIAFPPKRAACYSADLVTRQFAVAKKEKKGNIDYDSIQPVYTIILLEKSPKSFKGSSDYVHKFSQQSNTGVELELLQHYYYICLDTFRTAKPHVAGELEKWLHFLSIQDVNEMNSFLLKEKSFQPVYKSAIIMLNDKKGLIGYMSSFFEEEDIVASLNTTNESIIRRLKKELEEQKRINEDLRAQLSNKNDT